MSSRSSEVSRFNLQARLFAARLHQRVPTAAVAVTVVKEASKPRRTLKPRVAPTARVTPAAPVARVTPAAPVGWVSPAARVTPADPVAPVAPVALVMHQTSIETYTLDNNRMTLLLENVNIDGENIAYNVVPPTALSVNTVLTNTGAHALSLAIGHVKAVLQTGGALRLSPTPGRWSVQSIPNTPARTMYL